MLTCSVCCDSFDGHSRLPKFLSCHHTVCLQCLKSLKAAKSFVNCPLCRSRTQTDANVHLLPTNHYIVNMLASGIQSTTGSAQKFYKESVKRLGSETALFCSKVSSLLDFAGKSIAKDEMENGQRAMDTVKRELSFIQHLLETGHCPTDLVAPPCEIKSNTIIFTVLSQERKQIGRILIQPDDHFMEVVSPFVTRLGTFCNESSLAFETSIENDSIFKFNQPNKLAMPLPDSLPAIHTLAGHHQFDVGFVETSESHFKLQLLTHRLPIFRQKYPLFGRIVEGGSLVKHLLPMTSPSSAGFQAIIKCGERPTP